MNSPLNILHLEDNPLDAKLVELKLKNEQISCFITRVETQADFIAALEQGGVDLILSDFMLPHFDGMSALAITRARFPNVPFILLSGEMGEELAVQAIKGGATDFVVKGRLTLLTTAMRRAIKEIHERAERDSLQTQFVQSQKMQVFGQFAGGIAHDFNNILAVIIGYSDLMIHRIEPGSPLRAPAEEIRHAADRAAGLTRQLLTFSRKQSNQPVVLNLNDTLKNLEKMLRRLIHENIALSIHADQQIGNIKADAGQVGQVLMNLVVNARDAMPNGGALTLQTRNVTLDDAYVRSHPRVTPGRYVKLSVSDSGIGMPEHVKARLFEAFFTTKPEGKGTGLGLATCKNIVKQCDGHI